jgi:hypothetical protein
VFRNDHRVTGRRSNRCIQSRRAQLTADPLRGTSDIAFVGRICADAWNSKKVEKSIKRSCAVFGEEIEYRNELFIHRAAILPFTFFIWEFANV